MSKHYEKIFRQKIAHLRLEEGRTENITYVHYNHVRPNTYNNKKTPFEALTRK